MIDKYNIDKQEIDRFSISSVYIYIFFFVPTSPLSTHCQFCSVLCFRGIGRDTDRVKDAAQKFVEKTKDAASKSTDTINSAAYGTLKYIRIDEN